MPRPIARTIVGAALGLGVALTLTACGSDAKVVQTKDGKVTVTGTGRHAQATIQGDGGTEVTFGGQKAPSDFPGDVPLPEKVTLRNVASGSRDGKHYYQLTYTIPAGSTATATDAYRRRLVAAGFTTGDATGPASLLQADGHGWNVLALGVAGAPPTLAVTVSSA
ncbi:MAG: hypothetical protein ACXVJF_08190 [Acidimicrobiia bacterium]